MAKRTVAMLTMAMRTIRMLTNGSAYYQAQQIESEP